MKIVSIPYKCGVCGKDFDYPCAVVRTEKEHADFVKTLLAPYVPTQTGEILYKVCCLNPDCSNKPAVVLLKFDYSD